MIQGATGTDRVDHLVYPPLPALPQDQLSPRAWDLLARGIHVAPLEDAWLDTLGHYERPASIAVCRQRLEGMGIHDPELLDRASSFEVTFAGCAWEVTSHSTFYAQSYSIMHWGSEQVEDGGILYAVCGAHHYAAPEIALDTQGRILYVGYGDPEPVASSMSVCIEDQAHQLRSPDRDMGWHPVRPPRDLVDGPPAGYGFHPNPYVFDDYVQRWESEALQLRLSRPWGKRAANLWKVTAYGRDGATLPQGWEWI